VVGYIVLGTQWGDEGKGKVTDLLAPDVAMVVKYNGGNNAGHTVVIDDEKYCLHLLPSGILSPHIVPVIGNGVVVDLPTLFDELKDLTDRGVDVSKLVVSSNAHIIMPYHKQLDAALENDPSKRKIGTTKRGIGPTYADKISRSGIRVADLFDPLILEAKIGSALVSKNQIFEKYGLPLFNVEQVLAEITPYIPLLKPLVRDTSLLVNQTLDEDQKVLFEGGQATMLDVDFGTYPYVTSSNATAGGALTGTGVGPTRIKEVIGVSKAYCTKVGEGPFPTEISGELASLIRDKGGEYGVTTRRPRKVGWFDGVVAEYSTRVNGLTNIVLTKLDILTGLEKIPVCIGYQNPVRQGSQAQNEPIRKMPQDMNWFESAVPVYDYFEGWESPIQNLDSFESLPQTTQKYVLALEELSHCPIAVIGVGPGRDQVITRRSIQ
jgi:adenylosuccinate synthase